MLIMLRSDWPGDTFRRAGIEFQRSNPVEVGDETLKALVSDLGKALVIVNATSAKADHDATAEAAADLDAFLKKTAAPAAVNDAASTAEPASEAPAPTTDASPRRKR